MKTNKNKTNNKKEKESKIRSFSEKEVYFKVLEEGGITLNSKLEKAKDLNFVVSLNGFEKRVPEKDKDLFIKSLKEKQKQIKKQKGNCFIGCWINKGDIYLDISENHQNREIAELVGYLNQQKAIWNAKEGKEIFLNYGNKKKLKKHSFSEKEDNKDLEIVYKHFFKCMEEYSNINNSDVVYKWNSASDEKFEVEYIWEFRNAPKVFSKRVKSRKWDWIHLIKAEKIEVEKLDKEIRDNKRIKDKKFLIALELIEKAIRKNKNKEIYFLRGLTLLKELDIGISTKFLYKEFEHLKNKLIPFIRDLLKGDLEKRGMITIDRCV